MKSVLVAIILSKSHPSAENANSVVIYIKKNFFVATAASRLKTLRKSLAAIIDTVCNAIQLFYKKPKVLLLLMI
jgi:hypothetical protein